MFSKYSVIFHVVFECQILFIMIVIINRRNKKILLKVETG